LSYNPEYRNYKTPQLKSQGVRATFRIYLFCFFRSLHIRIFINKISFPILLILLLKLLTLFLLHTSCKLMH